MNIVNCQDCGRIYQRVSREICPDCLRKEEELFQEVKTYIRTHGHATVVDICEAIDISEEKLLKFMRDGRLISSGSIEYPCEVCGRSIRSGKLCEPCTVQLQSTLSKVAKKIDQVAGKEGTAYHIRRK